MANSSFYPITGIPVGRGPNGEVPVRMEVDDWWQSRKYVHLNQQTLLFSALSKMYDTSPHDKLSFYQIGGIHNQPLVAWDDTPFDNKNYCMHSQANFPTWHRPYVALLEQRLWEVMIRDIIPKFPLEDQEEFKHAANTWRFPYWDWAVKKSGKPGDEPNYDVPKLVREEQVEVRVPTGGTTKIRNPFYQFWMYQDVSMGDPKLGKDVVTREPYTKTSGTSRHAYVEGASADTAYTDEKDRRGVQNNDGVKDQLQQWKCETGGALTLSLRDWFYRILLICPYPNFATKKADTAEIFAGQYSSCEDIHDTIHDWGGGGFGHMGAPAVGAMDPLFWLHHCNIDRMLELWSGLHPKEAKNWLTTDPEAQLPLIPFRTNEYGDYHTARTTWHPESFGYTYPETKRWDPKYQTDGVFDEEKLSTELTKFLNLTYNSAAQAQQKAQLTNKRDAPAKSITDPNVAKVAEEVTSIQAQVEGQEVKGAAISAVPEGTKQKDLAPENVMKTDLLPNVLSHEDYVANVIYEKYALDGHPFTIRFFVGPVPDGQGTAISQAVTQVGEIYAFVDPVEFDKGGCENCAKQKRERLKTSGQIPLTNALLARFKQQIPHDTTSGDSTILGGMTPEQIIPFLKSQFHWRVTDREGKLIDKTRINSLKVSVAMGTGEHFQDIGKLSKFSDYKILYDITADAESGTGAAPEDNLFQNNTGLDTSRMEIPAPA